ncbi:MAG: cupin domain-containing protein [Hyphomicrobiaceae bacterium]
MIDWTSRRGRLARASAAALLLLATGFGLGLLAAPESGGADEGLVTRSEIRREDLAGTSTTEVVMTRLDVKPGFTMPLHLHHGDEFVYVIEGGMVQMPGKEPVELATGSTQHFAREVPHGGFTIVGDRTVKVLTVHVVDKGRPLMELVK